MRALPPEGSHEAFIFTLYPQKSMTRLALLLTLLMLPAAAQTRGEIRINQIQIIGTHNSYHAGLAPSEAALLAKQSPAAYESLEYKHVALPTQLDWGVRQFEFDIFSDTKGGLFAKPAFPAMVEKAGLPADPPAYPAALMTKPGFKVIHVQDLDYRSNCQPFKECLSLIRDWSRAHPRHLPIFILLENKSGRPRDYMVEPEPITAEVMDALDQEIRDVFRPGQLITPDDVRGQRKTLEEAVLKAGWPTLEQSRGKVIFLLDQERVTPLYTKGRPSLEGRAIFTNSTPGTPDAAFVKMNDATSPRIAELVAKGYLVRTMTDGGVKAVKAADASRRDSALRRGAHMLSTDYPFDYRAASGYSVKLPGGVTARCNPVSATPACRDADLAEK